jgi:hypothetical protein
MKNIIYILLIIISVSCKENIEINIESNSLKKELSTGIISAKQNNQQIELTVVVKDQFILQLFEGDNGRSKVMLPLNNQENYFSVKFEPQNIIFSTGTVSFSEEYVTSSIEIISDFSNFSSGAHEIVIAHKMIDNTKVPIKIKLIDFPPEMKAKIKSVESGLSKP